jgi:hypothetical protein
MTDLQQVAAIQPQRNTAMIGTRVQIPAYTDRWMMGDRYGEVVKTSKKTRPMPGSYTPGKDMPSKFEPYTLAHVKLDKSGKTVRVILDDCEVL